MKKSEFILSIIKKIESNWPGIIAFANKNQNETGTNKYWTICVSDFSFYMNNQRFKTLRNAWHKAGLARGIKIIFCACKPNESKLQELAEAGNLILNL